ncbi:MAG: hypothetical protein L0Y38_06085 [Methylococcaceae bacterium]|nr:hypothetical protein [Methylococcaceae bacterium]MCI0666667.1 hypothetical protein [Methylococcaceae bacterium]MCI0733375.1 hypothetical protein [Methylococcaceae bacterium]
MRLIHRFDQISGPICVTLLIVTQILSPLIHGHGGYDEPIRGFHMPGFENLLLGGGAIDVGSTNGFRYSGLEVIVSVASGIETKYQDGLGFDGRDLIAPAVSAFAGVLVYTAASTQALYRIPAIQHGWAHRPPRAPPHFEPHRNQR